MRNLNPDWRWKKVVEATENKTPPLDPFLRHVYQVCIGELQDQALHHCIDTITTPEEKDTLVAYFLSGESTEKIASGLWMDYEKVRYFGQLMIDMSYFRDKLEIFRYADYYLNNVCTEDKKPYIRTAVDIGPEALHHLHQLGAEASAISADTFRSGALALAYHHMIKSRGQSITSPISNAALKYMTAGTKLIKVLDETKDEEITGWTTAKLAIEERRVEMTVDKLDLGPEDEVFH